MENNNGKIYELYIYNIPISCIFFIRIRSHNKIVNNGDYVPQNHPIQLRYRLFFMRGTVVRNRRHNVDASHMALNAYFDEIIKKVKIISAIMYC